MFQQLNAFQVQQQWYFQERLQLINHGQEKVPKDEDRMLCWKLYQGRIQLFQSSNE